MSMEKFVPDNSHPESNQDDPEFTDLGLSAVVHELEGRVASIVMFCSEVDRLGASLRKEHFCERISRIRKAAEQVQRIVEAVKILRSDEDLRIERVDLGALAAQVGKGLRDDAPAFNRTQLRIESNIEVNADQNSLELALTNLLSNAFKFSANAANPCVTVSSTAAGNRTVIHVSDNGVGLATEDACRIFGLFARAHSGFEGSGVGLAIAKRIIERHGGRIWAQGEPGAGATFSFSL